MEKLIMLGTGHAMTLDCFNTCFVIDDEDGECVLVDTGGGLQLIRQLRDAKVDMKRIHDVFISHQHTDHLLGLFWLLRAMGRIVTQPDYGRPLTVYMHRELESIARSAVTAIMPKNQIAQLDKMILFKPVEDGEQGTLGGHPTEFFDLYSETETQYGFKMRLNSGKTLFFMGDVPVDERNYPRLKDADWLLHDAFSLDNGGGRHNRQHSTALSAACTAQKLGAKNLVLYHGDDHDLKHRKEKYIAEAQTVFGGAVYAPYDLDVIELG